MAGPEVGDIYLQTHADTKGLAAELRRAAKKAGKAFGADFTKSVDSSLGGLGDRINAHMKLDPNTGRLTGKEWAKQVAKGAQEDLRKENLQFDLDLGKAVRSGDFGPMFKDIEDVNGRLADMRKRITQLGKGKGFTELGLSARDAQEQLTAYVNELNRASKEQADAKAAADDLAASQKKQAAAQAEANAATKETARVIVATIKAQNQLAKANEKAAGKEQAAQLKRNQAAMRAVNKEMLEGIKYSEQLARAANMTESTKQTNAYRDAVADTARQLQTMQTQLNKMGSGKQFAGQQQALSRLASQVREAADQFTVLQRAGRDATVGMDRGTADFGATLENNTARVRAFSDAIRNIEAEIDVQANYPSAAEARARGTLLGVAFKKAVDKATSAPSGGGGGGGGGIFDAITREWNQFLFAFPAEVTILARYIALIGTEVATIGSAIGSSLTAGVASLGTAVAGLGAAAGGVFVGMAYSISLAAQAMKTFEDSFPATQRAIDGLKSTFEEVDVAGFANEWAGSVENFADTLSNVLSGAQLGSSFGAAAAQITNTFAGILQTPAFAGFIGALQNQIPAALVGIGNGVGALATALLPVLTAAAPLAQTLATQFATWAGGLATAANSAQGLSSISSFMTTAAVAVQQLIGLISNLGGALGNVFSIGAESGNRMLSMLAGLAEQFRVFTESTSGQSTIALWFAQGEQVMAALIPLLGAVGQMFGALVTPATVAQLVGLINGLTQLVPVLGGIMSALGQLNFLGLLVQLLNAIGTALAPVLPAIGELAGIIGGALSQAIVALQPALNAVGQVLGSLAPIFGALGPVIGALATAFGNLVTGAMPAISGIVSALAPVFAALADAIAALAPGLVALFVAFNPVLRVITLLLPVLQPLISVLAPIITFIAELATQFAAVLNPILETVASMLAFSKALTPITGGLSKAGGGFEKLAQSAGTFVQGIAKQLPQIATTIANVVAKVATSLAQVLPQVANALSRILPTLVASLSQLLPTVIQAITSAVPVLLQAAIQLFTTLVTAVTTVLPMVLQAILTALPQLIQTIVSMIPVLLQAAMQLFQTLVTAVITVVPMLIQQVLTLLPQLLTTILSMIPMLLQTAIQLFMSIVQALLTAIPQILTALLGMLPQLITTIVGMIPQLLQTGIQLFVSLVTAIATALPQILTALFGILPDLLSTIVKMIPQLITTGIDLFISLVTAIAKALPDILDALFNILPDLMDTLIRMIPQLITAAIDLFVAIVDGIAGAWPQIWDALKGLGSDIIDALGDIDLAQIGRDIMQSLWDGLQARWDDVTGWISGIGGWIQDHKGPPSYDRVLLTPAGRQIMDGLQKGLIQGMPGLRRTLSAVTGTIEGSRFRTQVDLGGDAMTRDVLNAAAANAGPRVLFAEGSIQVTAVTANPELVASSVVDRMVLAMQ